MRDAMPASIGSASMAADGTITLDLVTTGPSRGAARIVYPPSHAQYKSVLDHLGGMHAGESKSVPPWPDNIDDARVERWVAAYVKEKRGWQPGSYSFEIVGTDEQQNIAVSVNNKGSGTRLALRLDANSYVVTELPR